MTDPIPEARMNISAIEISAISYKAAEDYAEHFGETDDDGMLPWFIEQALMEVRAAKDQLFNLTVASRDARIAAQAEEIKALRAVAKRARAYYSCAEIVLEEAPEVTVGQRCDATFAGENLHDALKDLDAALALTPKENI